MKIKWFNIIFFFTLHIFFGYYLLASIERKDIFGCIIALVVILSPPQLWPKAYE